MEDYGKKFKATAVVSDGYGDLYYEGTFNSYTEAMGKILELLPGLLRYDIKEVMNGRYLNSFKSYGEAVEERDRLARLGYKNLTITMEYYS